MEIYLPHIQTHTDSDRWSQTREQIHTGCWAAWCVVGDWGTGGCDCCVFGEGTDLVALEEAEDVFDASVVGEPLHPDQGAVLGHHGRGVGLPCQGRC